MDVSRIFTTEVSSVYPHYATKVEKKGRTKAELDQVIGWLTGFDRSTLRSHLAAGTTFENFFAGVRLNPNASLITGVVCVGCASRTSTTHSCRRSTTWTSWSTSSPREKSMDKILRT